MDKENDIAKVKEKKRLVDIENLLEQAQQAINDNKLDEADILINLSQATSLVLISEKMDRLIAAICGIYWNS